MSGISKNVLWNVTRIHPTFDSPQEKQRTPTGTGFWLELGQHKIFVTNKHVTDPRLMLGEKTPYTLTQLEIELRQKIRQENGEFQVHQSTKLFKVTNLGSSLHEHPTADCAILVNPEFESLIPDFSLAGIKLELLKLASDEDFRAIEDLSPQGSFIGFPSNWYDDAWNLPISRPITLACYPDIPFSNKEIKTSDVHLVSGLSFKGSSGSPVFLHHLGVKIKSKDLIIEGSVPNIEQKLIGIMSGHWWEDCATPEMFKHSGLSYYTRSTAILDLLKKSSLIP